MKKHKHSMLIKAWADGAKIQVKLTDGKWYYDPQPKWTVVNDVEYRILDKYTEIRQAILEGKKIYFRGIGSKKWFESSRSNSKQLTYNVIPSIPFSDKLEYCTEDDLNKLIPYDSLEDLKSILGCTVKCHDGIGIITGGFLGADALGNPILQIYTGDSKESLSATRLLDNYKFEDGQPCGKLSNPIIIDDKSTW